VLERFGDVLPKPRPTGSFLLPEYREYGCHTVAMTGAYRTIAEPATAAFVVQGSEFIGHAHPVDTVEEAESFVDSICEEYADATHNVPAYRVRVDSEMLREYASDDGEPSGSAGKPALTVLTQQEIENCVVVVPRYYGGTNLGVGGLVSAYSRAVTEAIDEAGIVEEQPHERVSIGCVYDDSGTVRGLIESAGYEFEADYEATVSFSVRVPIAERDSFYDRLRSATSGRVEID